MLRRYYQFCDRLHPFGYLKPTLQIRNAQMNNLSDRIEALERAQLNPQRGLRRWRLVAFGIAAAALLLGQLQPGIAANGNGNAGGLAELQDVVTALTARVQALETKLAKVTVSGD